MTARLAYSFLAVVVVVPGLLALGMFALSLDFLRDLYLGLGWLGVAIFFAPMLIGATVWTVNELRGRHY
jgi:hypothetical protein